MKKLMVKNKNLLNIGRYPPNIFKNFFPMKNMR